MSFIIPLEITQLVICPLDTSENIFCGIFFFVCFQVNIRICNLFSWLLIPFPFNMVSTRCTIYPENCTCKTNPSSPVKQIFPLPKFQNLFTNVVLSYCRSLTTGEFIHAFQSLTGNNNPLSGKAHSEGFLFERWLLFCSLLFSSVLVTHCRLVCMYGNMPPCWGMAVSP